MIKRPLVASGCDVKFLDEGNFIEGESFIPITRTCYCLYATNIKLCLLNNSIMSGRKVYTNEVLASILEIENEPDVRLEFL